MAFGQILKDMQNLVAKVNEDFHELRKMMAEIQASQKRIELTVANLLDNKVKK